MSAGGADGTPGVSVRGKACGRQVHPTEGRLASGNDHLQPADAVGSIASGSAVLDRFKSRRIKLLHVAGYLVRHVRWVWLELSRTYVLLADYKHTLERIRDLRPLHEVHSSAPM